MNTCYKLYSCYNKDYLEALSVSKMNKLQTDIVNLIERLSELVNEINTINVYFLN